MEQKTPPIEPLLRDWIAGYQKLVVVGVGSQLRGDDGVGIHIILELNKKLENLPNGKRDALMATVHGGTAPESVTGEICHHAPSHVLFIDAADVGSEYGALCWLQPQQCEGVEFSTHMLPLKIVLDYLKMRMPEAKFAVIGVRPSYLGFTADPSLSGAVRQSAEALVALLLQTTGLDPSIF